MQVTGIISRWRQSGAHDLQVALLARQAETSRRLAIYDRETSWLSPWYMQLRVSEECARANRYDRPLSLLLIEPAEEAAEQLNKWLASHLRSTDLASRAGDGHWILLLPETDPAGASQLAKRIGADVALASMSIASFPEDAERFQSVIGSLDRQWPRVA